MQIQATPTNETRERVGYVKGVISGLSQYPVSLNEAVIRLDNESLVKEIFPQANSVFWVDIDLELDPNDPEQFNWSFPLTENIDMGVGTFCDIEVIVKSRSLFEYLHENIKESTNKVKLYFD